MSTYFINFYYFLLLSYHKLKIYIQKKLLAFARSFWRRDRDSNPGYAHTHAGFQDRCLKPTRPSLQDNINYINHYKLCQYIFVNFFIFYLSLITTSKFPVSGSIINPCTFIFLELMDASLLILHFLL